MVDARKVVTSALGHLLSEHQDSEGRAVQPGGAAATQTSTSSSSIAASRKLQESVAASDQPQSSQPEVSLCLL